MILLKLQNKCANFFSENLLTLRNKKQFKESIKLFTEIDCFYEIGKMTESLGYSKYAYDVIGATQSGVVYPSQDPSIFEVKFPNDDIKGRIVSLGTGTFGYGGY